MRVVQEIGQRATPGDLREMGRQVHEGYLVGPTPLGELSGQLIGLPPTGHIRVALRFDQLPIDPILDGSESQHEAGVVFRAEAGCFLEDRLRPRQDHGAELSGHKSLGLQELFDSRQTLLPPSAALDVNPWGADSRHGVQEVE